jgi:hypothetical protein
MFMHVMYQNKKLRAHGTAEAGFEVNPLLSATLAPR